MIDGLPPYPAYKDSGVPWLGKVPEHWEVVPLKRLAWFKSGAGFPVHYQGETSAEIPFFKVSDMNIRGNEKYLHVCANTVSMAVAQDLGATVLPAGTIVFPKVGGALLTNKRRIAANQCCIDNNMMGCVVRNGNRDFLFLIMNYIDLGQIAKPGPVPAISEGEVREIRVALPSAPEQTAIVRFLDYKDRRIRRSIRAKQKLIKLLEEYRQALIHQAVTGKIDVRTGKPYSAYKDSGVPWLGHVLEHWELKPLKRFVRLNASVLAETTPADYEFRYIDIGTVGTGFLTREPQRLRFGNAPSRARRVLHQGDTIISTVRTYLKAVYFVDKDPEALVCSTGFAVLTPGPSTQPKYVSYLVQSNTFTDRVTAESVGTAYPAIAEGRLGSFYVPVPPLPEQTAIVEYLDAETAKLDAAIAAARREIELLREYRERLIADVVTGKVNVREVAAQLPEEPPEEEAGTDEEEPVAEELATVDSQEESNGEE
ncbi:restriction endonuclease S subunit [Thermanaerovibrio velox DSM 12556]|uniref:Restriction endonuclease S subunit n=1 Tax=Thermanaerovibrio velox DSM 12556 TaxID=926567 RepID=H0UNW2_9BACT|nr:restriction endonuclease subunit S [Thermanaerovibrio velox]EHM09448.1 restriction endonuclease S subunit [Thermanaerovibrio velox DSM 12556]